MTTSSAVALAHTEVGDGPPLVMIMGLNAPGAAWRPHSEHWGRTFRCLEVDNRGAGASPSPAGPYSTQALAEDYAALIRRLDLGPCRVAGISMGAAVAQELALSHPTLVSRLLLVAPWARADPYLRTVLEVIGALRHTADEETFSAHLQSLVWTPEWFGEHEQELWAARRSGLAVGRSALVAQAAACADHDALDRLAQIGVPTLVTAGRADRFVPFAASEAVADAIPAAELVTFATGHVHHWEELIRFNRLTEEFLRG